MSETMGAYLFLPFPKTHVTWPESPHMPNKGSYYSFWYARSL